MQDLAAFYPFDQSAAQDEVAYRKALLEELDRIDSNPKRLRSLPR